MNTLRRLKKIVARFGLRRRAALALSSPGLGTLFQRLAGTEVQYELAGLEDVESPKARSIAEAQLPPDAASHGVLISHARAIDASPEDPAHTADLPSRRDA